MMNDLLAQQMLDNFSEEGYQALDAAIVQTEGQGEAPEDIAATRDIFLAVLQELTKS